MVVALIVLAAAYGVVAGGLMPRALYRFSVEPGEPWRTHCPQGHPVTGWLGPAHCRPTTSRTHQPPSGRAAVGADRPVPEGGAPGGGLPSPSAAGGPGVADGSVVAGARLPAPHRYGRSAARLGALGGGVCALIAGTVGARPEGVAYVGLAPVLVLLVLVDRAVHRLPDALTLPLAAATPAALGCAALVPGATGSWRLALLGGAALGAAYLLLHLINPAGLGFGDVKLALSLGVALGWYGWGVWAAGAFLGFLYGALYGLSLVLRGPATRKEAFAFGPFMAAGALTGVLLGGFGA